MCGNELKKLFLAGNRSVNDNHDRSHDKRKIMNTLSNSTKPDEET